MKLFWKEVLVSLDEVPPLSQTDSVTDGEVEDREKEGENDPRGERSQPGFVYTNDSTVL